MKALRFCPKRGGLCLIALTAPPLRPYLIFNPEFNFAYSYEHTNM